MTGLHAAYFTPNASYVMRDHQDGVDTPQVRSVLAVADDIRSAGADVVVAVSPHWQTRSSFFADDSWALYSINDYPLLPQPFGRPYFSYSCPGHPELASLLVDHARARGLTAGVRDYGLDHGAFTALKVMDLELPVVPVTTSVRPHGECREWGAAIREAADASGLTVVAVCPGNLSHRLDLRSESDEEDYDPDCARFDEEAIRQIEQGEYAALHETIDADLVAAAAPETGLRTFSILHGLTGGSKGETLMYKGHIYGVGDATIKFPCV